MSLTPPPPPPPHLPSSLLPSGCKTPVLARRLSAAAGSSSHSAPSPNQLRQILADITKQVTNSPQDRIHPPTPTINTFMRPSQRQTGPVTRSRSMLHYITPRSSITPRATRSNTPVRDENLQSNHPLVQTPSTPFNLTHSPSSRSILGASPHSNQRQTNPRHPIAPLRYRTLSSVSSATATFSSPTTSATPSSDQPSPHPTPSSSSSSHLPPSLRLGASYSSSSHSSPTPPLTPSSSSSNSHTTTTTTNLSDHTNIQITTNLGERRSLDQVESPSSDQDSSSDNNHNSLDNKIVNSSSIGSLAKRRKRNPSGLGRL